MLSDSVLRIVRLLLGAALVLAVIFYVSQYARSIDRTFPSKTFTVDGTADIDTAPDIATFSATVLSEGSSDVAALQGENAEKMNRVVQFMKEQGIETKDLKTQQYNLSPRYTNPICTATVCPPSTISGYTLNQTLQVKIRDLSKVGDLLSGAVKNGANSVTDVQFVLDDDTEAKNAARAEAIGKAREKAESIAEAGGFRLGKLVTLYENNDVQPYAYGMGGESMNAMKSSVAPAIEPGTQNTKVNVTLTYEILN